MQPVFVIKYNVTYQHLKEYNAVYNIFIVSKYFI